MMVLYYVRLPRGEERGQPTIRLGRCDLSRDRLLVRQVINDNYWHVGGRRRGGFVQATLGPCSCNPQPGDGVAANRHCRQLFRTCHCCSRVRRRVSTRWWSELGWRWEIDMDMLSLAAATRTGGGPGRWLTRHVRGTGGLEMIVTGIVLWHSTLVEKEYKTSTSGNHVHGGCR